jgi:hypothetical protein
MNDDRKAAATFLLFVAAVIAAFVWVGPCARPARSNPVERITARVRIVQDGRAGFFHAGGTIETVEYFPGSGYAVRTDSATLWVQIDGRIQEPAESTEANGADFGSPALDANGDGTYEWLGKVEGLETYRAKQPREPGIAGDTVSVGELSGKIFRDAGAFVRVTYQNFIPVDVTAWGTESLPYPDADGLRADDGANLYATADSTQFGFSAQTRVAGLRYVLRTLGAWTAGPDRWMRLEVTRDVAALDALQP